MSQTTTPPNPSPLRQGLGDIGSIRRARHRRMVAGVAEGISRHFDIDPTIVRVLIVVATFFGCAGLFFYLAAWLTVPEEGHAEAVIPSRGGRDADRVATIGLIAGVVIAAVSLLGTLGWAVPHPAPLAVIIGIAVVGLIVLLRRRDDPRQSPWWPPDPPGTGGTGATAPDRGIADEEQTSNVTGTESNLADTAIVEEPAERETSPRAATEVSDGSDGLATTTAPPPAWLEQPAPRRPRSHLFGLTLATIAIAMGGLWAFDGLTPYDLDPSVYPGVALGIVAAGLVVGTWFGRSRGLIVIGILASLATLVASFVGPGPYGDRVYRPAAVANLSDSYHMGVGHLVVNLEDLHNPHRLDGRTVSADMRIGRLEVVVPSSLNVAIDAHVSSGDIRGVGPVQHLSHGGERVSTAAGAPADLVLNLDLDFGQILVTHVQCPPLGSTIGAHLVPACS